MSNPAIVASIQDIFVLFYIIMLFDEDFKSKGPTILLLKNARIWILRFVNFLYPISVKCKAVA